ncbi:uncharacterized protein LOC109538041 isoform X1 [Dendroctonus ponderosae]|uniref:uncharacterized protein LOC109538041 isoform X1 n=1 Tax=Dendroctonus ponderosae TaxID=77166 RepID=UPI002034D1BF|nr:uncharacterized protein LOC109538041 isoform X1 [Dendroctonus ponderosae]
MFPKTSRFNKQESHKGSGPNLKQKFPGSPYGKGLNPCKPKPPIGPKGSCEQTSLIFNSPSSRLSENTFRLKKNHENYGRHSMEPPRGGASRTPKLFKSSTEQLSKQKSQSVGKARKSLPYKNDPETTASPQTSCIPRLKKKLTESVHCPSLLERPRIPHTCYPTTPEDENTSSTFDRYSAQRHPVKQLSKTPQTKASGDISATPAGRNRPLNVSYTVLPRIAKRIRRLGEAGGSKETVNLAVNVPDDIKARPNEALDFSVNFQVKHSSSPIQQPASEEKLIPDLSLSLHNVRSSSYYNIACGAEALSDSEKSAASPNSLRCFSLQELNDCNVVLLLQDQFIDENYDQCMKALDQAVETLQISQADTLLQLTEHMVRLVLNNKSDQRLALLQKMRQLLAGAKGSAGRPEAESLANSAINQLREHFEQKILKMTREKVSNLLAELKTTLLTANEDIEVACNEAVKNLILQLKKPALEPSVL